MSEVEEIGVSQYDGISPAVAECKFCKLQVDELYMTPVGYCKSCKNLATLIQLDKSFRRLVMPGAVLLLFSFFIVELRGFVIPILVLIFGPSLLLGVFQKRIHYFGVPEDKRIISLLRMYRRLSDRSYYRLANELWVLHYDNLNDNLRSAILTELVESVLIDAKSNPANLFIHWAKPTGKTEEEFIELLIDDANLYDCLSVYDGTGVLPDIWLKLSSEKRKEEILDVLVENIESEFHNAASDERKSFLEDLYLIEDDLDDFIDEEEKWLVILDKLDEFEPEIPPKNIFQQAQIQALHNRELPPDNTSDSG